MMSYSRDDKREVDEEVNQDKNGDADGMNLEVDSIPKTT